MPNKLDNIVLLILSLFRATSQKIFKGNNKSHTQDLVLRPNIPLQSPPVVLNDPGNASDGAVHKERDRTGNRRISQRKRTSLHSRIWAQPTADVNERPDGGRMCQ